MYCDTVDMQDPEISSRILCRGAPASPGAAVGAVVFSVAEAMQCALNRTPCILISNETSIKDMEGFRVSMLAFFPVLYWGVVDLIPLLHLGFIGCDRNADYVRRGDLTRCSDDAQYG